MGSEDQAARHAHLEEIVARMLESAKRLGATAAEAGASESDGLSVGVRRQELEQLEFSRDRSIGITVYMGQRKGSASTTDTRSESLEETVAAACAIARSMAEDEYAGLAPAERMATSLPDLDLYHPWQVDADQAREIALACEAAGLQVDPRIRNSEGAQVDSHRGIRVYGNSHGFLASVRGTRHSLSCSLIAEDDQGMERDYWYSSTRLPTELESPALVGERAAQRVIARLGARSAPTGQYPVAFAAEVAGSLFGHLIGAVSGGSIFRRASFLVDAPGEMLFPKEISVHERPRLPQEVASAAFDDDGVATAEKAIIDSGILTGYLMSAYSARRLGLESTGNAGGVRNVRLVDERARGTGLAEVLRELGDGLLVTEFLGQGVNQVTGDYSRGAAGFWVEGGEIAWPVSGVTVAGNLRDMFAGVRLAAEDIDARGNIQTGTVLIDGMTVGGQQG